MRRSFLLLFIISTLMAHEPFPEHIFVEDQTHDTTLEYYYLISNGKLWVKKRHQENAQWELFLQTGLPFSKTNKFQFAGDRHLVAVSADLNDLMVADNLGHLYLYEYKYDVWHYHIGIPGAAPLSLPFDTKAWTYMRKQTQYIDHWEDTAGNKHSCGETGVSTFMALNLRGDEIVWSDPGLPPDFSRHIEAPLRNHFISANVVGSGSIIMAIGDNGQIYTRYFDHDACGYNPMFFTYSYDKTLKTPAGKMSLYHDIVLPCPGWQKHSPLPLGAHDILSSSAALEIIDDPKGIGNDARELRVAAISQNRKGYFRKKISALNWEFVPLKNEFDINYAFKPENIIHYNPRRPSFIPSAEQPGEKEWHYQGEISFSPQEKYPMELIFNLHASPSKLTIKTPEKDYLLLLHTVEIYTYLTKSDVGRNGHPRLYWGTLELPDDIGSPSPLEQKLRQLHLKTFHFTMAATTNYIYMRTKRVSNQDEPPITISLLNQNPIKHSNESIKTLLARSRELHFHYCLASIGISIFDILLIFSGVAFIPPIGELPSFTQFASYGPRIGQAYAWAYQKNIQYLEKLY